MRQAHPVAGRADVTTCGRLEAAATSDPGDDTHSGDAGTTADSRVARLPGERGLGDNQSRMGAVQRCLRAELRIARRFRCGSRRALKRLPPTFAIVDAGSWPDGLMARIVHICPRYAPAAGGVELFFRKISEALARTGHSF